MDIKPIEIFKERVILTGPKVNLLKVYNTLIACGVVLSTKTVQPKEILFCENSTTLDPSKAFIYQHYVATNKAVPLDWFITYPTCFWQSRMWWNYYYNIKFKSNPSVKTLNICKQQSEFFDNYCLFK